MLVAVSDTFFLGLVFGIIGIALLSIAQFWPGRKSVVTHVEPLEELALGESARFAAELEAVAARNVTWPREIDADAGALTADERRHVLDGLGIVGDAWSTGVLLRAYAEETSDLRVTVIENIARCLDPRAGGALYRAYSSPSAAERYAAIDGASRRGEVPLLERGIRDTETIVVLAAAYGLKRAKRDDLVDSTLHGRTDPTALEVRRVLNMLG